MSGDPLRFPLGRRVLQRGMQTSRSKTRKSCQRNIRSVRGSPTATIQRLLAYSVHEFRFSLLELPSYQVGFHLSASARRSPAPVSARVNMPFKRGSTSRIYPASIRCSRWLAGMVTCLGFSANCFSEANSSLVSLTLCRAKARVRRIFIARNAILACRVSLFPGPLN